MIKALTLLDLKIAERTALKTVSMLMGGGGAMILAHGFPQGTVDIDAIAKGLAVTELDGFVKEVAGELSLEPDWLNPYFANYSHTLPPDYADRLVNVFNGKVLKVEALGKEEMLIMKCFAHRTKDIPHARALIRAKVNLDIVENRMDELLKKKIPGTQTAIDFLQEVLDSEDV